VIIVVSTRVEIKIGNISTYGLSISSHASDNNQCYCVNYYLLLRRLLSYICASSHRLSLLFTVNLVTSLLCQIRFSLTAIRSVMCYPTTPFDRFFYPLSFCQFCQSRHLLYVRWFARALQLAILYSIFCIASLKLILILYLLHFYFRVMFMSIPIVNDYILTYIESSYDQCIVISIPFSVLFCFVLFE